MEHPSIGVSGGHTSVPRWDSAPPEVDASGRAFLVVSSGAAGRTVAAAWIERIEALGVQAWTHHDPEEQGDGPALLAERLSRATVGARVMAAGPELAVFDALRAARAAGAIDAEIRLHVTGCARRRIQCPHCTEHIEAVAAIGDVVPCEGCGRSLIIYHHVSRSHGAYLGYMVDAEEAAV